MTDLDSALLYGLLAKESENDTSEFGKELLLQGHDAGSINTL